MVSANCRLGEELLALRAGSLALGAGVFALSAAPFAGEAAPLALGSALFALSAESPVATALIEISYPAISCPASRISFTQKRSALASRHEARLKCSEKIFTQ
jgi:hypothetical protein